MDSRQMEKERACECVSETQSERESAVEGEREREMETVDSKVHSK